MRFSLRALLLSVLVIASGLGIFRLTQSKYPQGAIIVVYGDHPPQPGGTQPWSVVRFDERIVCRSANPVPSRTVFPSPFPLLGRQRRMHSDGELMEFGVIGLRADGTSGLLTVGPGDLKLQHVMTPYGPALPINGIYRGGASPYAITITTYQPDPPWREWLSVAGDGADGVIIHLNPKQGVNVTGGIAIRPLHSTLNTDAQTERVEIPADGGIKVHFSAVPDGQWYATGSLYGQPPQSNRFTLKPVCFEKKRSPSGVQVIEFR